MTPVHTDQKVNPVLQEKLASPVTLVKTARKVIKAEEVKTVNPVLQVYPAHVVQSDPMVPKVIWVQLVFQETLVLLVKLVSMASQALKVKLAPMVIQVKLALLVLKVNQVQ